MEQSRIATPPTSEPVTLAQAKANLRVDHDLDDLHIQGLITAARQGVELYTAQSLMPQTREFILDKFSERNFLPYGPVQSIVSINYIDPAGNEVLLDSSIYKLHKNDGYDFFTVAPLKCFPSTLGCEGAIIVNYTCGYANAETVPKSMVWAMFLQINELYENRERSVVGTSYTPTPAYESLLDPLVRMRF